MLSSVRYSYSHFLPCFLLTVLCVVVSYMCGAVPACGPRREGGGERGRTDAYCIFIARAAILGVFWLHQTMVAMVLKEGFKTPQNEVLATLTSCLAVRDKIVTGGNLWKHGGRLSHAELRGLVVGKERELSHTSVSLQMVRLAIQERQQWLIANGQAVDALASSTSEPPVRYVPGEGEYWHPGTATARRRVEDRVEHRMQAALAAAEQAAVEVRKLRPEPRAIPVAEVNWPAEQADPEPPHSAHPRPGRQCGSVAPRGSLHAAFGWEESGLEPIMAVGAGGYDEYYDVGEGYDATAEEYNVDGMLPVVLPGPPFPSEPIDPAVFETIVRTKVAAFWAAASRIRDRLLTYHHHKKWRLFWRGILIAQKYLRMWLAQVHAPTTPLTCPPAVCSEQNLLAPPSRIVLASEPTRACRRHMRAQTRYRRTLKKAVLIQHAYRTLVVRRVYHEEKQRRNAILMMQTALRTHIALTAYRRQLDAVRAIQRFYRKAHAPQPDESLVNVAVSAAPRCRAALTRPPTLRLVRTRVCFGCPLPPCHPAQRVRVRVTPTHYSCASLTPIPPRIAHRHPPSASPLVSSAALSGEVPLRMAQSTRLGQGTRAGARAPGLVRQLVPVAARQRPRTAAGQEWCVRGGGVCGGRCRKAEEEEEEEEEEEAPRRGGGRRRGRRRG